MNKYIPKIRSKYYNVLCNHFNSGVALGLMVDEKTGTAYCNICGAKWQLLPSNINLEYAEETVNKVIDMIQSLKYIAFDTEDLLVREKVFRCASMIPDLEELPNLINYAIEEDAAKNNTAADKEE